MPWSKKEDVKGGGVKDLSTELSAGIFLRKIIKCKIWRVRISGKAVGTCHLSWIVYLWADRCASWPPLHQHQPGFLPQTPGFVASEIWICRLRNQILWRRECQRHSREGIFLAFTATRPCVPLQNSFPINGGNENKGRNIRQTDRFNQAPL